MKNLDDPWKVITHYKCTKHQFIHLLTAILKNSHIENSKNHKRWYCPHHTGCVSMLFSVENFHQTAEVSDTVTSNSLETRHRPIQQYHCRLLTTYRLAAIHTLQTNRQQTDTILCYKPYGRPKTLRQVKKCTKMCVLLGGNFCRIFMHWE